MNSSNSHKTRVCVIAGARSTEHEVSLISAYNIVSAIDTTKYDIDVIGISKDGVWKQYDPKHFVENPTNINTIKLADPISGRLAVTQCSNGFYDLDNKGAIALECDVVFPAVLGNYAEDGTIQGLLRMMDIPFTTPDVLGSAVGMDKDVAYRLLRDAGINVAQFITLRKGNMQQPSFEALKEQLGSDVLFIKPSSAGSSIGVTRVTNEIEYETGLTLAFKYDVKVIVQAGISGRELEIGVIGNIGNQRTSVVGEIIENKEDDFYSYENKYVHSSNVQLLAPAPIRNSLYEGLSQTAIKVCEVLECEGFGRVDFFVTQDETIYVNEINTMPGFTAISMFPRVWNESGLIYSELIDTLLQMAIERHEYRIRPIVTDAADVLALAQSGLQQHE